MAMYPWAEIQAKYETGNYTMKELSEEYGFNEDYGYRKAGEQGWIKGKSQENVRQMAAKKAAEMEAETQQEIKNEYATYSKMLRRFAAKGVRDGIDFEELKKYKIASEIFANTKKMDWSIFNIKEPPDQMEVSGKDGGPIEYADVREELTRKFDQLAERRKAAGDS